LRPSYLIFSHRPGSRGPPVDGKQLRDEGFGLCATGGLRGPPPCPLSVVVPPPPRPVDAAGRGRAGRSRHRGYCSSSGPATFRAGRLAGFGVVRVGNEPRICFTAASRSPSACCPAVAAAVALTRAECGWPLVLVPAGAPCSPGAALFAASAGLHGRRRSRPGTPGPPSQSPLPPPPRLPGIALVVSSRWPVLLLTIAFARVRQPSHSRFQRCGDTSDRGGCAAALPRDAFAFRAVWSYHARCPSPTPSLTRREQRARLARSPAGPARPVWWAVRAAALLLAGRWTADLLPWQPRSGTASRGSGTASGDPFISPPITPLPTSWPPTIPPFRSRSLHFVSLGRRTRSPPISARPGRERQLRQSSTYKPPLL